LFTPRRAVSGSLTGRAIDHPSSCSSDLEGWDVEHSTRQRCSHDWKERERCDHPEAKPRLTIHHSYSYKS